MDTEPSPAKLCGNKQIVEHALGKVRTFIAELQNGTKNYKTIASLGGQIAEAYRGRCVLELLQNAYDALADASENDPGLITFSLKTTPDPVLLVANSGDAFKKKDFEGLCQLGQSPKDPNKSVGNKGLGFRSVLEVTSSPEIWSTKSTEEDTAFVFRFDPAGCDQVAAAIAALDDSGLATKSPFDPSIPLVDWNEDQLERYRDRLSKEQVDGPNEVRQFLSPYDIPLLIGEQCTAVDNLLRAGHVTVIRLPLDGGRRELIEDAVDSVNEQLEKLLDLATTLFLPRLKTLIVEIDDKRFVVTRTVETDDAYETKQARTQIVSILRTTPMQDENTTGRFRIWTRNLGGASDPEWAERIHDAVQHLPNKWPDVDRAEIGVAVREGPKPAKGRFTIFLPTEMPTGTGAHINAPFFGGLDRRSINFSGKYNALLLECIGDLCLDAVDDLLVGEPKDICGRAIVDILGAWEEIGGAGKSVLKLVRERADERDTALDGRALILCDDGWTNVTEVREMPAVSDGLAIDAADWRRAAAFSVMSSAFDGREAGVKALVEGLEGRLTPTSTEWARTVESVAQLVQSGKIDATWDGFLTSLLEVLPYELRNKPRVGWEDALETVRFLPAQDGRLISVSDKVQMFFRPMRGIDDAADLVETVPKSLKRYIAFIHGDIRTHEDGVHRRKTDVHKFLDDRFARGFEREEIVRNVVLKTVPQLPAAFGSRDADLCAELLDWTIRLVGDEPSEILLHLLRGLPVACHGGWHSAKKTVFGPGWPAKSGDNLWKLADDLEKTMGGRLRSAALLPPGDPRWGLNVGQYTGLFTRIGVVEGLRLSPVDPVCFHTQRADYELPREAPFGINQETWNEWRTVAQRETEATPVHQGLFEYSLEDIYQLPELHGAETLTPCGRQALSQLVLDSMCYWPSGWDQATVRKIHGEWNTWKITSPLKHWLSTLPWLEDGSHNERPLRERWLVPISLLQGQHNRYQHLQPLTLGLLHKLKDDPNLTNTLKGLGLNFYPTDGERIGPELLNALATAWQTHPEFGARFNIFLGQVRHAWRHFDENDELPDEFLVWSTRHRFEIRNKDGLYDVYLPDEVEKGRTIQQSGKSVLEMQLPDANRLAALLVEKTGIRRASNLEERVLIDGTEWTETSDGARNLEDTRYKWLPTPLLAIAAYGGQNPTGTETQSWTALVNRLRYARVIECESIVVELLAGEELIVKNEPFGWWLPGDVLAVTRETKTTYEKLAPAAQAMLNRQDLLQSLQLVLGAIKDVEQPSAEDIKQALYQGAYIDVETYEDVQSYWAGDTVLLIHRIRPVAELYDICMDQCESAASNADNLIRWLTDNVPQWDARELISAARRSRDDHAMGLEAWRALGDAAQLPLWNAVLEKLGDEYEPVENNDVDDQTSVHLEELRPLFLAVSCYVAINTGKPELFLKLEDATKEFKAPDSWSKQWWEVPFSAVLNTLYQRCRETIPEFNAEELPEATSIDELQDIMERKGVNTDVDPYETARDNRDRFRKILLEAHDLHCTWAETHVPESEVPKQPLLSDLGAEAYLLSWSEAKLWHYALEVFDDEKFIAACGDTANPDEIRGRLGLDEAAVETWRQKREEREKEATHKPKMMEIAGESFEVSAIDYERLREHINRLTEPTGPQAKDDEFTPPGTSEGRKSSSKNRCKKHKGARRRLSPEETQLIGVVGEIHAYRYLRKEFGGRAVQTRAWVSETRLEVFPLVEGELPETDDGHGFDFRFSHKGIQWRVEVKATSGNESSFDLGISEIRAATDIARRQNNRLRWRILRIRKVLSEKPEFDWLPNPFEEGFRNCFRLRQGGMHVSYERRGD